MNFREYAQKRQSCRDYDPTRRPTKEQLENIVTTASLSPSACNSQPWKFYVVNDETISPKVAKCTQQLGLNKYTVDCPAFIVICEQKVKLLRRLLEHINSQHYAQIDIGIAAAGLCYAAIDEGLSTCILGCFDEPALKELLGIGEEEKVRLVICVGYAKDDTLREKTRKSEDEILKYID